MPHPTTSSGPRPPRVRARRRHRGPVRADHRHPAPGGARRVRPRPPKAGGPHTTFLFFGTFRRKKGVHVLLAAIEAIRDEPDLRFVFAGRGDPDVEEAARDAAAATADHRGDRLRRGGPALGALPGRRHDGAPVPGDAGAERRPPRRLRGLRACIAANVGPLSATVREEGTGWVCRPGGAGQARGGAPHGRRRCRRPRPPRPARLRPSAPIAFPSRSRPGSSSSSRPSPLALAPGDAHRSRIRPLAGAASAASARGRRRTRRHGTDGTDPRGTKCHVGCRQRPVPAQIGDRHGQLVVRRHLRHPLVLEEA